MKLNISVEFLIVVFLFISIMIVSTYGSTKIMPFEPTSSQLAMYPYRDGFTDYNTSDNEVISGPTNVDNVSKVKYSMSSYIANVKPNGENDTPDRMQRLQGSNYGTEQKLDVLSDLPSNASCANISSGLSNSKGYLCPTKEIQNLYTSRGGNASGKPAQIGA